MARRLALGSGDGAGLEVWLLDIARLPDEPLDLTPLDPEERRRAERLTQPEKRRAFIASRLLLRELLSARIRRPAEEIDYARAPCPVCGGPNGRPVLAGPPDQPQFSLSRSDRLVLVAVADSPVGVDIQALPDAELAADVSSLLHAAEREEIATAPPSDRPRVFARLWTRKEAYLKGTGTGLVHELDSVYVGSRGRTSPPPGWSVLDLPAPHGYVAAVAIAGAESRTVTQARSRRPAARPGSRRAPR